MYLWGMEVPRITLRDAIKEGATLIALIVAIALLALMAVGAGVK